MGRISDMFQRLQTQRKKALISFITAGDPSPEYTLDLMHTLVENGVDMIELGVPFSDPMADGPVIQKASERALKHHVSLRDIFSLMKQFREKNTQTPVILMGYLNPIEVMGYQQFSSLASQADIDGVLTVDCPPEESQALSESLRTHKLDTIFLLSPTTTESRVEKICHHSSGFVYYVSLKGVTGSHQLDCREIADRIQTIRKHTDLPIGVGFGIKDAETASQLAEYADAVIIGSALVRIIEQSVLDSIPAEELYSQIGSFIKSIRDGLDNC